MNAEEMYQNAEAQIEGKDGFKKNEKKGWQAMLEAANAGSKQACAKMGEKYYDDGKYADAIDILDKNNAKFEKPNIYAECYSILAAKNQKDKDFLQKAYAAVDSVSKELNGDGYWFFSKIIRLYKPEEKDEYEKILDLAAFYGSDEMPDEAYASINRTRNVFASKEEFDIWMSVRKKDVRGFVPVKITEEQAWTRAKANLDDKEAKKILGSVGARKLEQAAPKGELEYQQIIRYTESVGSPTLQYKYDHPNYTTVTQGSSKFKLDWYWYNLYPTFKTKTGHTEFTKAVEEIKLTDTYEEGRFRYFTEYNNELVDIGRERTIKHAYNGIAKKVKDMLHDQYNWEQKYITTSLSADNWDDTAHCYYIFTPFWFFTLKTGKKTSVTVRVDAYTGECEFFANNPYGQFEADDDIEKNGGAKIEKGKSPKGRKKKKSFFQRIGNRIKTYVILLGVVAAVAGFASGIVGLGIAGIVVAGLGVWWRFFKK